MFNTSNYQPTNINYNNYQKLKENRKNIPISINSNPYPNQYIFKHKPSNLAISYLSIGNNIQKTQKNKNSKIPTFNKSNNTNIQFNNFLSVNTQLSKYSNNSILSTTNFNSNKNNSNGSKIISSRQSSNINSNNNINNLINYSKNYNHNYISNNNNDGYSSNYINNNRKSSSKNNSIMINNNNSHLISNRNNYYKNNNNLLNKSRKQKPKVQKFKFKHTSTIGNFKINNNKNINFTSNEISDSSNNFNTRYNTSSNFLTNESNNNNHNKRGFSHENILYPSNSILYKDLTTKKCDVLYNNLSINNKHNKNNSVNINKIALNNFIISNNKEKIKNNINNKSINNSINIKNLKNDINEKINQIKNYRKSTCNKSTMINNNINHIIEFNFNNPINPINYINEYKKNSKDYNSNNNNIKINLNEILNEIKINKERKSQSKPNINLNKNYLNNNNYNQNQSKNNNNIVKEKNIIHKKSFSKNTNNIPIPDYNSINEEKLMAFEPLLNYDNNNDNINNNNNNIKITVNSNIKEFSNKNDEVISDNNQINSPKNNIYLNNSNSNFNNKPDNEFNNSLFDLENLNELPADYDEKFDDLNSIVKKIKFNQIYLTNESIFTLKNKYLDNYNEHFSNIFNSKKLNSNSSSHRYIINHNLNINKRNITSSGQKENISFSTQADSSYKKCWNNNINNI